ncbi:hypothetical protein J6590_001282 [Homalodisca vitripennis]|nr:hypothetical protein J6590_001282 [Homalodisca vitripennis]
MAIVKTSCESFQFGLRTVHQFGGEGKIVMPLYPLTNMKQRDNQISSLGSAAVLTSQQSAENTRHKSLSDSYKEGWLVLANYS